MPGRLADQAQPDCDETRLLPFLLSWWLKDTVLINRLSIMLPACIMILLVAYGLQSASFVAFPFAMPEIVGLVATLGVVNK